MFLIQIILTILLALFGLMFYIAGNPEGGRLFAIATVVSFGLWIVTTALTTRPKR